MQWRDIDLDDGQLPIRNQLQRVSGVLHHRGTKTEGSTAPLPLPALCIAALRRQSVAQTRTRERAGPARQSGDWVVTTRSGTPVEPQILRHAQFAVTMEIYAHAS